MTLWKIVSFLLFAIKSTSAENYENRVISPSLKGIKDQFIELERLGENIEDSSFQSLNKMKDEFRDLVRLNCNFDVDNVNITLRKFYKAFESHEKKILQNTEELKIMKEIVKNLAKHLPDASAEKADVRSIINNGSKQTESLPTSFQLEKIANKTQTVQTMSQSEQYLSYTTRTTMTTATPYLKTSSFFSSSYSKDLPAGASDCETQPLPSTYCHQYQILWYFNTDEGRCNRFRKGCENTFRNSYKSHSECSTKCVRPGFQEREACFLPRSPGICNGIELSWFFDWRENRCRDFIYSGCLGNQNRFKDEETCRQHCGSLTLPLSDESGFKTNNTSKASKVHTTSEQITKTIVKHTKAPTKAVYQFPSVTKGQSKYNELQEQKSIQSTKYEGHYPDYKDFMQHAKVPKNAAYDLPSLKKGQSKQTELQKQRSIPRTKFEGHYPEYKPLRQHNFTQAKQANRHKQKRQKTIFKGSFRNRKRKYRHFLYTFNDQDKRRSKVSKTLNLRVELHAPKDIEAGRLFKLKCIVSGSLAEAVEIIWDRDDDNNENGEVGWKKREMINKNNFSYEKSSILYVPGIYSSVRFTCLVSCYDPQAAKRLPKKLRKIENAERVENYLCAFDSVKLKPNDQH